MYATSQEEPRFKKDIEGGLLFCIPFQPSICYTNFHAIRPYSLYVRDEPCLERTNDSREGCSLRKNGKWNARKQRILWSFIESPNKMRQEMKSFNGGNMNLFQSMDFDGLLTKLEILVEDLIKTNELPDRGVIVAPNFGKAENNKGEVISYSITANEPDYPASEEDLLDKNRHHSNFITLKAPSAKIWQGLVEIQVGAFLLTKFPPPPDSLKVYKQKSKKSDGESGTKPPENNDRQSSEEAYDDRFRIPLDSSNLIEWVRAVVQYKISNYVTAAPSFGCCSQFQECSDAKKCIHPNRMYSTACAYRYNLEAGRIFYGRNRNI